MSFQGRPGRAKGQGVVFRVDVPADPGRTTSVCQDVSAAVGSSIEPISTTASDIVSH